MSQTRPAGSRLGAIAQELPVACGLNPPLPNASSCTYIRPHFATVSDILLMFQAITTQRTCTLIAGRAVSSATFGLFRLPANLPGRLHLGSSLLKMSSFCTDSLFLSAGDLASKTPRAIADLISQHVTMQAQHPR